MTSEKALYVLIAPTGQLCGNGQLRETISERRNRLGPDVAFWYLCPALVKQFQVSNLELEAVVAEEKTAIEWLQLRFGGDLSIMNLDIDMLKSDAMALPPPAQGRDISSSDLH
ncbi:MULTISPECIES: hypothetical protein [unclassified Prochlorococcus]|uniref:hypothetical protein n=1 Tax=unclassified Prochlorococcus TaxID=2627481 RepID=UPI000533AD18|nr:MULTISPECIES: hypothetical protein [unclassified Prochlorococcus]KGG15313.1 hypothetical protein EV06_1184 [Prochlorococcus sp. MIT 0602]KGG17592.1 hypothetical protein EV07_1032 [Prochlorococcus sp. MIT 0603]